MTTVELKNILIHRISGINDISFLNAIKTIVDSKSESVIPWFLSFLIFPGCTGFPVKSTNSRFSSENNGEISWMWLLARFNSRKLVRYSSESISVIRLSERLSVSIIPRFSSRRRSSIKLSDKSTFTAWIQYWIPSRSSMSDSANSNSSISSR